ncbi:hypothetical protein OIU78_006843 [Salix suchowensis]|nr:hypothetical protein OIU78_006843 [Salix suchowensis]
MEAKWCIPVTMVLLVVVVSGDSEGKEDLQVRKLVFHAAGFWDFHSFISAAAAYQPLGFGTTGGKLMGQKEVAENLMLAIKVVIISGGYGVATGGPLAWGLCYDKEMSPSKLYCDDYYEYAYPCTPGVSYHGREFIENNATLAFQAAIWKWMTPGKKHQPSAHDAVVGIWKPTKNDTLAKRVPGFGTTMNVLYGDKVCGKGDDESMNNIVSHYLQYLDLMGRWKRGSWAS